MCSCAHSTRIRHDWALHRRCALPTLLDVTTPAGRPTQPINHHQASQEISNKQLPLHDSLQAVLCADLHGSALDGRLAKLCVALERTPSICGRSIRKNALIHCGAREILELRAKHAASLGAVDHGNRRPFAELYASHAAADAPTEAQIFGARVRRVGWEDSASAALPAEARRLLEAKMAFVSRGHELWPDAERQWGDRCFLRAELVGAGGCAVLASPSSSKDFLYWLPPRRHASLAVAMSKGHDRVLAPEYEFDEPSVEQLNLTAAEFFSFCDDDMRDARARGKTFYLQHCIVKPSQVAGGSVEMRPTAGLGANMARDITEGLNRPLLEQIRQYGHLGPWVSTVLFVGGRTAGGARTRLHFDQVDNIYLQVSGVKRFRIFDPSQAGALAPYPWHHPLDRSAQVDLRDLPGSLKRFPRLAEARGAEVELRPGDMLFLPAYWWHEVLTDETAPSAASNGAGGGGGAGDESGLGGRSCGGKGDGVGGGSGGSAAETQLTVSVNFWFRPLALEQPSPPLPLSPMLEAELARQLEMVIADALNDRGALVPPFLRALRRQLEASVRAAGGSGWPALHKQRPAGVEAADWESLFEYVVAKLCLWLPSPAHLLPFLHRHCCASRFDRLLWR